MEILVFKTNLANKQRISDVEPTLNVHPHIISWNVDLNDHDNVLRIICGNISPKEIEHLQLSEGYYCEELL